LYSARATSGNPASYMPLSELTGIPPAVLAMPSGSKTQAPPLAVSSTAPATTPSWRPAGTAATRTTFASPPSSNALCLVITRLGKYTGAGPGAENLRAAIALLMEAVPPIGD